MKNFLRNAALTAMFFCLTSVVVAQEYTLTDDDVTVVDGYITECTYNYDLKEIVIPNMLDGQTVIGIATLDPTMEGSDTLGVFSHKDITSVKLPTTLQYIGANAFREDSLKSLDLTGLSALEFIGSAAFNRCLLSGTLDFSDCTSLRLIRNSVFSYNDIKGVYLTGCNALESIDFRAFFENRSLDTLSLNGCTSLTTIGERAFMFAAFENLDLSAVSYKY